MGLSLTKLRANLFRVVDRVIETGEAVSIDRKGEKIMIVPVKKVSKLSKLKPHPGYLNGDLEDIVNMDWSSYWKGDAEL